MKQEQQKHRTITTRGNNKHIKQEQYNNGKQRTKIINSRNKEHKYTDNKDNVKSKEGWDIRQQHGTKTTHNKTIRSKEEMWRP